MMQIREERQKDRRRRAPRQRVRQRRHRVRRHGEHAVGPIEKHEVADAEHGRRVVRLVFTARDELDLRRRGLGVGRAGETGARIALAAVGHVDECDPRARVGGERHRAAAAEHLVVHVRGEHDDTAGRRCCARGLDIAAQQRELQAQRVLHGLGHVAAVQGAQRALQQAAQTRLPESTP